MVRKIGTNAANTMQGSVLADQLFGLGGNDILNGLAGNDLLDGGKGADRMTGGKGNDVYVVDNANDRAIEVANQGIDTVRSSASHTLGANVENLALLGSAIFGTGNSLNNVITGTATSNDLKGLAGDDMLIGGAGVDQMFGGEGNDTLLPGAGNGVTDVIDGGNGFDTVDYRDALAGVDVDLNAGTTATAALNDFISNVENVVGSQFSDRLVPSAVPFSSAVGGGGGDTLIGDNAPGYGRLRGDDGTDLLFGAAFEDDFMLQYDRGADVVYNYRLLGEDHIFISREEFGLSTPAGNHIALTEFTYDTTAGPPVFTADYNIIFQTSTKILWADKDGAGSAFSPIPIAFFTNSLTPSAFDIWIF